MVDTDVLPKKAILDEELVLDLWKQWLFLEVGKKSPRSKMSLGGHAVQPCKSM